MGARAGGLGGHGLAHDLGALALQQRVDGQAHDEIGGVLAGDLHRLGGGVVQHPAVVAFVLQGHRRQARGVVQRAAFLLGGDPAFLAHIGQDQARAGERPFHVVGQGQARRGLGQAGQQGRFRQGQLAGGLAEIGLRRAVDAIGAGPEIDAVQIELEDFVLGEHLLQLIGQQHLLQLALHNPIRGEEQALGQLLGQGRGALAGAAGAPVGPGGPADALQVDGPVLVEAPVLGRHEGLGYVVGHRAQGDALAIARAARGDHLAVAILEADAGRAVDREQRRARGQGRGVLEVLEPDIGGPAASGENPDHERDQQHAPDPAPLAGLLLGRAMLEVGAEGLFRRRGRRWRRLIGRRRRRRRQLEGILQRSLRRPRVVGRLWRRA